jgi:two-component system phosphate regulon sensor histidine kinase PhoR
VIAALLVGVVVARRITAPIAEMTEVAEAMRGGNYERRVAARSKNEIGVLGDTLNRLGREVTRQIAALSQERAQLQAIVAGMVEGVLAVDEEDRLLFCNRAAAELLGSAAQDAVGRRLREVARLADLPKLLAQARRGGPGHQEIVLHHAGAERVLDVHVTRFDGGQTRGLVIVLHDITDLRRLERIRRDFVANVSHELKTPLTSIKGFVETLLGGAIDDQENNVRFLQKIDTHVERLTNLVRDLLSLARIESQEGPLKLRPVDCHSIVREAVARHEVAIKQHGLRCTAELDGKPTVVLGDHEAITQILDNLLDNAVKYTPQAGEIRVRLRRGDGEACIEVEDTGIGIPKSDLDRVFERFYRVDRARSRELGGTGLGLSIVKHLAQAMKGTVRVESELGKGSRFTVCLRLG